VTALEGVHVACALVDECVRAGDGELAAYLTSRDLSARIYALPWVLSFGSAIPPSSQTVKVFDFLFCNGLYWIVPWCAALVLSVRAQLVASPRPWEVLNRLPPLDATVVARGARSVWENLSTDLQTRIIKHPHSPV
jgi:cell cycle arrest protein BUB2